MAELALLTAVVVLLQCFGGLLRLPFLATSFNLTLIPIAIGAILLGPRAGAWLGLVCGAVVLIYGITGADLFTYLLFQAAPIATVLICLVKTTVAGLLAGLVFRLLRSHTHWGALFATAATVPVVNTGLFILGSFLISGSLTEVGRTLGIYADGASIVAFIFVTLVGTNFIFFELIPALVLTPAVDRILFAVRRRK
jgi:uncharacterized membrane protein